MEEAVSHFIGDAETALCGADAISITNSELLTTCPDCRAKFKGEGGPVFKGDR
jgi:hypothetical protein